ncbi:MAG: endonuclease/exonuclease/phosphatase family protein [Blastocatellia bacterium]|jgi:endonuclease/exonuclease/phosphatase family metal-dependent hydrolase
MAGIDRLRVATYNVHKCRGLDRRVSPERIVGVLREIDADVIALQEVVCVQGREDQHDQAHFIARQLGMNFRLGENRLLQGAAYGNVVISRYPITFSHNHDISIAGREQRGCLRVDVDLHGKDLLHVYNVHLGTSYFERRQQARQLLSEEILINGGHVGPRLLLGDFNEWTQGLASRLLARHFECADLRLHLGRTRTYPGILPVLHLDHIYFDNDLTLEGGSLHRSPTALIASDHLPIVADFRLLKP